MQIKIYRNLAEISAVIFFIVFVQLGLKFKTIFR